MGQLDITEGHHAVIIFLRPQRNASWDEDVNKKLINSQSKKEMENFIRADLRIIT